MKLRYIGMSIVTVALLTACSVFGGSSNDTSAPDASDRDTLREQADKALIDDVMPDGYTLKIDRDPPVFLASVCGKHIPDLGDGGPGSDSEGYDMFWSVDDHVDVVVRQRVLAFHSVSATKVIDSVEKSSSCGQWDSEKAVVKITNSGFKADRFADDKDLDASYGYCLHERPSAKAQDSGNPGTQSWLCSMLLGRKKVATAISATAPSEVHAMAILKELTPIAVKELVKAA